MSVGESVCVGGNVFTYILAVIQNNPVLSYIEFALAIISSIVIIGYRLWKWWKEAKKDGKIDKEEVKEGLNILIEGGKEIKDKIDKKKEEEKDGQDK